MIPKIPGFKVKRALSKKLDQVEEQQELDYSPMKSGQIDNQGFGNALDKL